VQRLSTRAVKNHLHLKHKIRDDAKNPRTVFAPSLSMKFDVSTAGRIGHFIYQVKVSLERYVTEIAVVEISILQILEL